MRRTWDACTSSDNIVGTCPWEWQDRAVGDKSPTKLYEFDPATGINYVKVKGIVDANRHPRAELWNLKMIYSPIQVQPKLDESSTPTAAVLAVTNRYSFTDLSTCETAWTLLKEDKQVATGTTHAALAPRASGKVKIDLPAGAGDADTLRVAVNHPAKG